MLATGLAFRGHYARHMLITRGIAPATVGYAGTTSAKHWLRGLRGHYVRDIFDYAGHSARRESAGIMSLIIHCEAKYPRQCYHGRADRPLYECMRQRGRNARFFEGHNARR